MRPFLVLSIRDDVVAATELADLRRAGRLAEDEVVQIRVDHAPLPELDLDDYSGVILGGSAYNASDPDDVKSETQHRVEADLFRLLDELVEKDFPFLGLCYGVGTLGRHQGGVIDGTYGEPAAAVPITLSDEAADDQLASQMAPNFNAYVAHKEAMREVPPGAVVLASSPTCPVQLLRVRNNLYASQFHPELDTPSFIKRMEHYKHSGYFHPDELQQLIEAAEASDVSNADDLLRAFVARFAR